MLLILTLDSPKTIILVTCCSGKVNTRENSSNKETHFDTCNLTATQTNDLGTLWMKVVTKVRHGRFNPVEGTIHAVYKYPHEPRALYHESNPNICCRRPLGMKSISHSPREPSIF